MQGEVEKGDEISVSTRNVGQGCLMGSVESVRGRGGGGSCHVPATDRTYDTSVDIQYLSTRRWRAVYPDGL